MKRTRSAVAALGISTVLVVTGCSADQPEPASQLSTAFSSLEETQAMSMTISIDGDLEGLSGLSEERSLTQEQVEQITSSSAVVGVDRGEDAESTADDASSLDLVVDGSQAGALRYLKDVLYLQVNAEELSEKYPEFAKEISSIEDSVASTPELGTFQPLLDGKWGSFDVGPGSTLRLLLEQAGSGSGQSTPKPEDLRALRDSFDAIGRDAVVVRDDEDEDHLTVSVNVRQAYATLRPVLEAQFAGAGALTGEQLPAVTDAPDAPLEVEVWLEDDQVKRIELDLTQFGSTAGQAVLRVEVEESDPVEAPDDASEIDINPLLRGLAGGGALPQPASL